MAYMAYMATITRPVLRTEVAHILLEHPKWGRGRVYDELGNRFGKDEVEEIIKPRAVGNWMKELKKVPDDVNWRPWHTQLDSPVRPSFLFRLETVVHVLFDRVLLEREAKWAARLELDLDGLDPIAQYFVISEYASRDAIASMEGVDLRTGDLDSLLVLKPWTVDGENRYRRAFELGVLVPPSIRLMMIPRVDPQNEQVYFSWRGCRKLGVPFEVMQETTQNLPPMTFTSDGVPPKDRAEFLLNADWYEVLMAYWEWRTTTATSEKVEGGSSNE